ncbi:MAG: G5 domain-containing protein, partial [Clostridia bacterium]|nr:G5 domain-containing protein [Clostridia bacterium]
VSADTVGTEPVSEEPFPADTTGNTADPLPVQDPEKTAVPVPVQEPEETTVPVPVQEPEETETELLPEEKEEEAVPETAEPDPAPAETTAEEPVPEASCAVETEPPAADEADGSPMEDGNDNVSAPETEETDKSVPESTEQPEETPVPAEETADAEEQDPDEELLMILHRRKKAQAEEPAAPPAPEKTPADVPADPVEEQEADEPAVSETASTTGKDGRKLWILPIVIAILASIALLIGIPAFSEPAETVPDFDMTLNYGEPETEMETGIPSETDGAGREEQPVTETTPPAVKFNVTLDFFDRDPLTVSTSDITLEALLERVNYVILDTDRFSVDLSALLTEETTITVDTVTYGTARETITIPFETKTTNVQTIPRGQRNVTQYGKDGSKTITYTTEIVNGVEVSRTVAKEEITVQPVTETCQVGIGGTLVGNDGKTYSYSYYRMVNATYYDIEGLTYLGYEADESVVAVDMDYIPLGTKIYVKNDQFDFGVRVAADTGSMIEGWEVDIWLDDSNPQKADFAYIGYVKNMIIYYLD